MIRLRSLLTESDATADSISWAKTFQSELGLTAEASAAMAANIQHESGFIPNRLQGPGIKTGTMADSGKLGYSWAQWTFGPRKQAFRKFILNKFNIDINKQSATNKHAYAFLKSEIGNYPGFNFDKFKRSTNLESATEYFVTKYEQAGKPMLAKRIEIAREILNKIKLLNPTQSPKSTQTTPDIDVTYTSDNPPYTDLLKNPIPKLIASVLKQSQGTFNDYEAWAEAAFMAIKTKSKYAQVTKILGRDAYEYVKSFMNTDTKYHKQAIDISYKSLR
jgi:hypothetical protein